MACRKDRQRDRHAPACRPRPGSHGGGRTVDLSDLVAVCEPGEPIYPGLRETGRVERGGGSLGDPGGKPYHVVINAENYHALQALGFCYAGRVDCVYIDPPYNTGAKDWKYNNDYVGKTDAYRHSKWLAWMERRLQLAKTLLNPDNSVLIVTIDEKEYLRLGCLLEELFPEGNIQMISTVIKAGGVSRGSEFNRTNEFIYFVYIGDGRPSAVALSG
ncbi:MAG: site-specific DNA-methyltransferase, partial [Aeriscardovia sp.]|nr:site-specific DNA-methyltransferase [Aeriscardovia sp.]